MSSPCKHGQHTWKQCVCLRCGTNRHQVLECYCLRCDQPVHKWDGCQCVRCGAVGRDRHEVDEAHCRCARCGAEVHTPDGVRCKRCRSFLPDDDVVEGLHTHMEVLALLATTTVQTGIAHRKTPGKIPIPTLVIGGKSFDLDLKTLGETVALTMHRLQELIRGLDQRDRASKEPEAELLERRLKLYRKVAKRINLPTVHSTPDQTVIKGFGETGEDSSDERVTFVTEILSPLGARRVDTGRLFMDTVMKMMPPMEEGEYEGGSPYG